MMKEIFTGKENGVLFFSSPNFEFTCPFSVCSTKLNMNLFPH